MAYAGFNTFDASPGACERPDRPRRMVHRRCAGGCDRWHPGLPTTVFFIIAAWAFSKSSPRLEAWVLGLPRIGPMVHDHRNGLGMPRRAKFLATAMIALFAGGSAWLVDSSVLRSAILAAGAIGIAYITLRVPSKERVLAERAA